MPIKVTGWAEEHACLPNCHSPLYHASTITPSIIDLLFYCYFLCASIWFLFNPIATDVELAEHKLLATFVAQEENVFNYSLHRNPGFAQGQVDHISVMADVIARIHETHTSGASPSAHVVEVLAYPQTNYFNGWVAAGRDGITFWVRVWNIIKWVAIAIISSIVGSAAIWLVRKCHLQYKAKVRDEEADKFYFHRPQFQWFRHAWPREHLRSPVRSCHLGHQELS